MTKTLRLLERFLEAHGVGEALSGYLAQAIAVAAIVLVALVADFVAKKLILAGVKLLARRTETDWDDALVKRKVFDRLAQLAPALVVYVLLPLVFPDAEHLPSAIQSLAVAYMILMGALTVDAFLSAVEDIYESFEIARARPITTYVQVTKIVLYLITGIFVLATLLNRSPWGFLTGIGAMTAVIMLVFKDTILGFVASIQLTAHDMIRRGDWIEVPKYGADGDVLEITVNTVKVQNWDKTITTIPTYALIADSFKNWRGMSQSGGRRIKRAVHLDMNSVRICTAEMLDRFEKIQLVGDYVRARRDEIQRYNTENQIDTRELVNGRRMTNLGTFRAYVAAYLRSHPKIRQDMTFLVRHLPPASNGIGLEFYVFSADQAWANYEGIQADIVEHLLAVIPEFGLRVFQSPSGADVRDVGARLAGEQGS